MRAFIFQKPQSSCLTTNKLDTKALHESVGKGYGSQPPRRKATLQKAARKHLLDRAALFPNIGGADRLPPLIMLND